MTPSYRPSMYDSSRPGRDLSRWSRHVIKYFSLYSVYSQCEGFAKTDLSRWSRHRPHIASSMYPLASRRPRSKTMMEGRPVDAATEVIERSVWSWRRISWSWNAKTCFVKLCDGMYA
jgi:hypothetical protein